jgi:diguanylate cyclase (GGDEF)-like protein/PAS domain S-box-containing protein
MDEIVNSHDLLFENERLRKELHNLTQAQNDLLTYKHQLNAILDNAPVEINLKDQEGRYVMVNSQFERIFGVKNEDIVGLLPSDIHHSDLAASIQDHDLSVLNSGKVECRDYIVGLVNEDKPRTVSAISFPIFDSDGKVDGLGAVVTDITAKVLAEDELRKSNTLFSQAEAMGNMGHFYWDIKKDKLISCSDQYARIYGKTVPEALDCFTSTQAVVNLIHPDDKERFKQNSYIHNELPKGFDGEYRIITSSGDTRHLYERSERVFDNDGEPSQSFGTLQDITEKKRVEEELKQSNALFHQAEAIGNMGHWSWDLVEDKLISCSDQFARIHGMTVPEALDYFISTEAEINLIHPDDKEYFRQAQYDHKESYIPLDVEYRIINSAGDTRHVHDRSELVLDSDGAISGSFGSIRDITESKQAEELLQKSNERFEISQKFSKAGSWEWDIKSGDLYWSRMISKMFGGQEGALSTSDENFILATHPDDRQLVLDAINSCIEDDKDYNVEYRVVWPDGTIRWLSDQGNVVRNKQGEAERMLGIVLDITAEKEKEFVLIQATEATLEVNRELTFQKHALDEHAIVSIADVAGNITYVNDKFCAISGYNREELIGNNDKIVTSDEHPDEFFVDMWKAISSGHTWHGEIQNTNKTGNVYWVKTTIVPTLDDKGKPFQYVGIRTEITAAKKNEEKLKFTAHYDLLTGLPNRVLLADRLNHAMVQCQRRNQSLAVAYMDLDGFKVVNDTYGHDLGDKLLVELSKRMKEALREGDTLARIGGDEFIAIMVDLENFEGSKRVLERLLKTTAEPVTVDDTVVQVSLSIGVTLYPQDGVDADQLMRHADQAMYIAKQAGKNRYQLFDAAQDSAIKIQQQSIGDVRSAMGRREFVLHYQPKVNMHTGEVIGVEALIRWQHPDRGLVPPLDFLPAIEGHAISLDLGEWVIDTALSQINQWQSIGVNLPISVNISAYQLQQEDFVNRLAALLAAHPDENPHYLELEILETSVLSDIDQVFDTMNACHDLGIRFSLDDFGTGYSSLTHLRRLPAHMIKIDQSFVRDMLEDVDDLAIVEGVVGLAKAFKREVIAEGVETIEHGSALLQLGCDLAQGYGIARPMPAGDILEWISSWKADDDWQAKSLIA